METFPSTSFWRGRSPGRRGFRCSTPPQAPAGGGGVELCWTRAGVRVPPVQQVSRVFRMLFVADPAELSSTLGVDYAQQGSFLDAVNGLLEGASRAGKTGRDRRTHFLAQQGDRDEPGHTAFVLPHHQSPRPGRRGQSRAGARRLRDRTAPLEWQPRTDRAGSGQGVAEVLEHRSRGKGRW